MGGPFNPLRGVQLLLDHVNVKPLQVRFQSYILASGEMHA